MSYDPTQTCYGGRPIPPEDFPGAEDAVELCESLKQWDMYYRTAEAEGLSALKAKMRLSAEQAAEQSEAAGEPERAEVIRQALSQWNDPQFLLYLKKKLY